MKRALATGAVCCPAGGKPRAASPQEFKSKVEIVRRALKAKKLSACSSRARATSPG